MKEFAESELILNDDGSLYHLHLLPSDIASTIILVGDQDRVGEVSKYFDRVEIKKQKREFNTHTGYIGNKRLSVVSTGIGTDNIDIVMNELDALVNIDLMARKEKIQKTALQFIRIGTSGSLQQDVPVDSVLISSHGLGLDSLLGFYNIDTGEQVKRMHERIREQLQPFPETYFVQAPGTLKDKFSAFASGITATCSGFYAPQGRILRIGTRIDDLIGRLNAVKVDGNRITNLEMETAAIYGMCLALGHEAVSVNAILANRITGEFSRNAAHTIDETIRKVLEMI